MIINWLLFFVLFWIFGIYLFNKDKKIVLIIAPLGATLGHTINSTFTYLGFWHVVPISAHAMSRLPANIGIYAVLSSFMIYLVEHKKLSNLMGILAFSLTTTFSEYVLVLLGRVLYYKGWNIFFTFLSYLFAYFVVYLFYSYLKKLKIL